MGGPQQEDSQAPKPSVSSQAINGTLPRRFLVRAASRFIPATALWPWFAPRVRALPGNLILKRGRQVTLSEAHVMRYIAENTTIPVPQIITAFESKKTGKRYILMRRLPGQSLDSAWRNMDETTRENIIDQLRGYIDQLKAIEPLQPDMIGAFDYVSQIDDERLMSGPFGPFKNQTDFHLHMRANFVREDLAGSSDPARWETLLSEHDGEWPIQLTHGDLGIYNIQVENGKINGILDWEMSGWFPAYWEYTCTWLSFFRTTDLRPLIPKFMQPYPQELEMETRRRRLCNL